MLLCAFCLALLLFNPPLFFILCFLYFVFLLLVELAVPLLVLACLTLFYYHCWYSFRTYLEKWLAIADYSRLASVVDAHPTLTINSSACPRVAPVVVSSPVACLSAGVVAFSGGVSSRGVVSGAVAVSGGAVVSRGSVVEVDFSPAGVSVSADGDGPASRFVRAASGAVPALSRGDRGSEPAAVIAPIEDVPFVGEDDEDDDHGDDVYDELAFLFSHLTVDDPLDEDAFMAPPFDWRYMEPADMMEIDDDLLSIMSCHLDSSPFVDLDEDVPIDVDMPLVDIPSHPATPPPPPPPSPTPTPMEVDLTLLSPTITATATAINITAATNTINTAITTMPTTSPQITSTATTPTTSTRHPTREDTPPPPSPPMHRPTTTTTTNSAPPAITIPRIEIRPNNFLGTSFVRVIPAPTTSATTTTTIRHPSAPSPRPQPRGAMPQPTMRPEAAAELAHLLRELGAVAEEEDEDDDEE